MSDTDLAIKTFTCVQIIMVGTSHGTHGLMT